MEQLSIKIKIADREYPMKVEAKDEEMVRKAGKILNDKFKMYRSKFGIDDKQDLLSMVAFDVLVDNLSKKDSTPASDHDAIISRLRNLNDMITGALT